MDLVSTLKETSTVTQRKNNLRKNILPHLQIKVFRMMRKMKNHARQPDQLVTSRILVKRQNRSERQSRQTIDNDLDITFDFNSISN